jgi:NADH-quinone oxidoreductase subunit F
MREGRKLRCVIPGGSSTPVLTPDQLDFNMDFDSIVKVGSMLGSAGTIVIDDSACMVWVARKLAYFYKHESCGKCSPCREGTGWLLRLLDKIEEGRARSGTSEILSGVCDSIMGKTVCAFGDAAATPAPVHAHQVPRRIRVPRAREGLLRRVPRRSKRQGEGRHPQPAAAADMT